MDKFMLDEAGSCIVLVPMFVIYTCTEYVQNHHCIPSSPLAVFYRISALLVFFFVCFFTSDCGRNTVWNPVQEKNVFEELKNLTGCK